jgi:hypothetical protein
VLALYASLLNYPLISFVEEDHMEMVKLGGKGRQAVVYPVEIYSDARVKEFLEEDHITPDEARRIKGVVKVRMRRDKS